MLNIKFPEKPREDMVWIIDKAYTVGVGGSRHSEHNLIVMLEDSAGNTFWQTNVEFSRPYYALDDEDIIRRIEGQVREKWDLKIYRDALEDRLFGAYDG